MLIILDLTIAAVKVLFLPVILVVKIIEEVKDS
jgi:hypothetical protein